MDIKRAVRTALAMRGLNQRQLAEKMRIHPNTLSSMINKDSATTGKLSDLAQALDMKLSELVALGE